MSKQFMTRDNGKQVNSSNLFKLKLFGSYEKEKREGERERQMNVEERMRNR